MITVCRNVPNIFLRPCCAWINVLNSHSCKAQFSFELARGSHIQKSLPLHSSSSDMVSISTTLPPLLMGGARKGEQRKSATTDFFTTSLKLFLRYDIFFKAKGKHLCSSAPILIGSLKNSHCGKIPPTLYLWFKHTQANKTIKVLKFQAYSKNLLDLEWLPL